MPLRTAASNSSSLQALTPVSGSGVILGATMLPKGVSIGRPPANRRWPGRVWQLAQSPRIARYWPFLICVKSCGSDSPATASADVNSRAAAQANAPRSGIFLLVLRIDQWSRMFEILTADRFRRPERKRADGAGRVVASVLRERAGAEHKQIRHVPVL